MMSNQLDLPVVKGYSNAKNVHFALTDPYSPFERAPAIQSIVCMFVKWDDDSIAYGDGDMPNAFEKFDATDIAYIDDAKLHDVDFKGKPYGKKRLAELPPFEKSQSRRQSLEYGSVEYSNLETPFILSKQRAHIQSMFPVNEFPFAHVLRIQLRGKRHPFFQSLVVIEPDATVSSQLTLFVMASFGKDV